ncbi:MAG: peptide chain release factor N(5)-glutamine methyltransferase [Rhizobiaceae bacterium]|nr:peptide chain release factor N(5)-glutamine methyltransferase [Rhizobiaceae bacterium]
MADGRPTTLGQLHSAARRTLEAAGLAEAALDARLLVEAVTGTTRTDAVTAPEKPVAGYMATELAQAIRRRLAGEPAYRIIGRRDFYGLELALSPDTLEPRPDTETLVDLVLPPLREIVARRGVARVLDLGTGTGAIALALLKEVPGTFATATDIAQGALDTAAANALRHGLAGRFSAVRSNWFDALEGRFDLIVSNPPYIESGEIALLSPEVRLFDPRAALDGGADGLDAYRAIAAAAGMHLAEGGVVAVETGHLQKAGVTTIFLANGYAIEAEAKDLGGRDRALLFRRTAS